MGRNHATQRLQARKMDADTWPSFTSSFELTVIKVKRCLLTTFKWLTTLEDRENIKEII